MQEEETCAQRKIQRGVHQNFPPLFHSAISTFIEEPERVGRLEPENGERLAPDFDSRFFGV